MLRVSGGSVQPTSCLIDPSTAKEAVNQELAKHINFDAYLLLNTNISRYRGVKSRFVM